MDISHQGGSLHRVVMQVEPHRPPTTISPLRVLRALNGLSAAELARLADLDRSTIRRLEAGIGQPQSRTARKIAAVLNCPAELLFPQLIEDSNSVPPAVTGRKEN